VQQVIVIAGPTASGKSALAVKVAKKIGGEIISADSMQVYRGMDIGTAKPTLAEQEGIPHHLIDVVEAQETFSAADFQRLAQNAIADIQKNGRIPIIAGGTGFYINALIYGCDFSPLTNQAHKDNQELHQDRLRQSFMELAESSENGGEFLHNRLRAVDPESAAKIHANNIKRVARALAYYEAMGRPISTHNAEQRQKREPIYNTTYIILHRERSKLYEAINQRVLDMIARGLPQEVKRLLQAGVPETSTAMQGLGYKEMIPYLNGQCSLEDTIAAIQQGTRRYAKRQLTWFRHQTDGHWLLADELTDDTIDKIKL